MVSTLLIQYPLRHSQMYTASRSSSTTSASVVRPLGYRALSYHTQLRHLWYAPIGDHALSRHTLGYHALGYRALSRHTQLRQLWPANQARDN